MRAPTPRPRPNEDEFLKDPDDLRYEILCISCHEPLWRCKVLKRDGERVVSTETIAMSPKIKFNRNAGFCPICARLFLKMDRNGQPQFLIRDLNSGIERLI